MDSWNPMEEDFRSAAFNSYDRGPGRNLPMDHLPQFKSHQNPKPVQLYITGIPGNISEIGLLGIFKPYGNPLRAYCGDLKPGMVTKYGFLDFSTLSQAQEAMTALNGAPPYNLRIQFARSREEKQRMAMAVNNERENFQQKVYTESLLGTPPRPQQMDNFQVIPQTPRLTVTLDGGNRKIICEGNKHHNLEDQSSGSNQRPVLRTTMGNNMRETDNGVVERRILQTNDEHPSSIVTHQLARLPCTYCNQPGGFRCQLCKVWYCGQQCQIKDWPQHKLLCQPRPDDASSLVDFNAVKKQDNFEQSVIVHKQNDHVNRGMTTQNDRPNVQNHHSNYVQNTQNNRSNMINNRERQNSNDHQNFVPNDHGRQNDRPNFVSNTPNDRGRNVPNAKSPTPKDRPETGNRGNQDDGRGSHNNSSRDTSSQENSNMDNFKKPAPVGQVRVTDGPKEGYNPTPQKQSSFRGGFKGQREGRPVTPQNQSGFRGGNRDRQNSGSFRQRDSRSRSGFSSETDSRSHTGSLQQNKGPGRQNRNQDQVQSIEMDNRSNFGSFQQRGSQEQRQSGLNSEAENRSNYGLFAQQANKEQHQNGSVAESDGRSDYGRGRTSVRGAPPVGAKALRRPHSKPTDLQADTTGERTSLLISEFFASGPCKVQICHLESPDEMYVQKVANVETIANLTVEIHQEATCAKKLNIPFVPDELCIALYDDGCWYRAKVIKVNGNSHEVYFVDYGNTETVQLENMRLLPMRLRNTPAQAQKCALAKVAPLDGAQWKAEEIEKVKILLSDQELDCKLVMEHEGKALVDLVDYEGNHVSNLMIDTIMAKASPLPQSGSKPHLSPPTQNQPPSSTLPPSDVKKTPDEKILPPVSLSAESTKSERKSPVALKDPVVKPPLPSILSSLRVQAEPMTASVTWIVNEKLFWVTFFDEELLLKVGEATVTLGEAFEKESPGFKPSTGQVVSARASDGDCYRGYIKGKSNGLFSVLFLDFGNEEDVEAVAPLPPALASFASPCIQLSSETAMKIEINQTVLLRIASIKANFVTFTLMNSEGHELSELIGKSWFSSLTDDSDSGVSSPALLPSMPESFVMFDSLPTRVIAEAFQGIVVWVQSPKEIYIQSLSDQQALEALMVKVTEWVQASGDQRMVPVVDQVVLALFEDGSWYRARVVAVTGDEAFVHFCDFGNQAKLSVNDLRACPPELAKDAPFAFQVSLEGIEELTSEDSMLLVQEPWQVRVVSTLRGVPSVLITGSKGCFGAPQEKPGNIQKSHDPTVPNLTPVPRVESPKPTPKMDSPKPTPAPKMDSPKPTPKMDSPKPTPAPKMDSPRPTPPPKVDSPKPQDVRPPATSPAAVQVVNEEKLCTMTFSDQPYVPLPIGQTIATTVASVSSPDLIFINYFSNESQIEKFADLTAAIQAYCATAKPNPHFPIQQASFCLAQFHEDKQWYRAVVLWKTTTNMRVLFIDFGNMETISMQEWLPIPQRFMEMPIQAIQCKMHGILSESWSETVTDKLRSYLLAGLVELEVISNEDSLCTVDIPSVRLTMVQEGLLKPDPIVPLPADNAATEQAPSTGQQDSAALVSVQAPSTEQQHTTAVSVQASSAGQHSASDELNAQQLLEEINQLKKQIALLQPK